MKVKSAVIDTNVLISAALSPNGTPAKVVKYFVANGRIIFSNETYEEFNTRIWRPKFDPYISREKRKSLLLDFSNIADWFEISGELKVCRDPDDDKFLELAIRANAWVLVSGDRDLTDLGEIEGISIVTPAECLDLIV